MSKPKGEIEWQVHRTKDQPAPGAYTPKTEVPAGGGFNLAKPKTELDWVIHRAKESPGPASYYTELCPCVFSSLLPPPPLTPCGGRARASAGLRPRVAPRPRPHRNPSQCRYQVGPTFKARMDRHKGSAGGKLSQDPGKARGGGAFLRKGQGSGGKAPSAGGRGSATLSSSGQSGVRSLQRQMRSLQAENTALKSQLASTK